MKNSRKYFDLFLLLYVLLHVLVFNYLGWTRLTNKIAVGLFILRLTLFCSDKIKKSIIHLIPYFIIFAFLIGANIFVVSSSNENSASNLLMLLYAFTFIAIIIMIAIDNSELIYYFLSHIFWPINIYHIINLFIMFQQVKDVTFMQATATFNNTFHQDLISGFLGFCATPEVALFACFTIIYNFSYALKCKHPYSVRIYTFFIIVANLLLATENDNKALFIILPYVLFWFYLDQTRKNTSKRFKIFFTLALIVAIVLLIRLPITDAIFEQLGKINKIIFNTLGDTMQVNGSNERIGMIMYAFSDVKTLFLGHGVGTYGLYEPNVLGFYHFGQADLGTLLILCGFWITILIIMFYYKQLLTIITTDNNVVNNTKFFIIIYMLILSIAYQVYTSSTKTILMVLIVFAIWYGRKNSINKSKI